MNKHKHQKRDEESLQEWINRISIKDTSWFRKAKRRQRFRWFYDLKFYLQLKYIMLRRNGKKN
jgi:hypothetical protein